MLLYPIDSDQEVPAVDVTPVKIPLTAVVLTLVALDGTTVYAGYELLFVQTGEYVGDE